MSFVTIGTVTTIACLNMYMKTYLYFFALCTTFTNVGTENFHKNYAVTLRFVKMEEVGVPLCLGT